MVTVMTKTRPYVIVTHKPSRRSFTLDRQYQLLEDRGEVIGVPLGMKVINTWDGWCPTKGHGQMPAWAEEYPDKEFYAQWVQETRTPVFKWTVRVDGNDIGEVYAPTHPIARIKAQQEFKVGQGDRKNYTVTQG